MHSPLGSLSCIPDRIGSRKIQILEKIFYTYDRAQYDRRDLFCFRILQRTLLIHNFITQSYNLLQRHICQRSIFMTFQEQAKLLHDAIQQLMHLYQDLSARVLSLTESKDAPKKTSSRSLTALGYSQA